jgi:signal transduction histidine kinase
MYKRKMSRLKKLEIEKFQENERKRIAAELHDDLGSKSTSIKMLSELAKNKNQGILKGNELDKIITNANALVDSMGDIIWAMNTNNDSINGLMQYIKLYAEDYLNEHEIGFQFSWDAAQGAIHIQGDKRRNILLVIKEILHNTVKHAHANKVSMDVSIVNNTLQLLVKDDGLGFSESDVKQFSNGILNMQERIKKIGGEIQIKNHQGTQTSLQIPV